MEEEMQFIVDTAKENMELALKHLDKEILRFAVNQEYIVKNIDLNVNDEIAIFPPVSGG